MDHDKALSNALHDSHVTQFERRLEEITFIIGKQQKEYLNPESPVRAMLMRALADQKPAPDRSNYLRYRDREAEKKFKDLVDAASVAFKCSKDTVKRQIRNWIVSSFRGLRPVDNKLMDTLVKTTLEFLEINAKRAAYEAFEIERITKEFEKNEELKKEIQSIQDLAAKNPGHLAKKNGKFTWDQILKANKKLVSVFDNDRLVLYHLLRETFKKEDPWAVFIPMVDLSKRNVKQYRPGNYLIFECRAALYSSNAVDFGCLQQGSEQGNYHHYRAPEDIDVYSGQNTVLRVANSLKVPMQNFVGHTEKEGYARLQRFKITNTKQLSAAQSICLLYKRVLIDHAKALADIATTAEEYPWGLQFLINGIQNYTQSKLSSNEEVLPLPADKAVLFPLRLMQLESLAKGYLLRLDAYSKEKSNLAATRWRNSQEDNLAISKIKSMVGFLEYSGLPLPETLRASIHTYRTGYEPIFRGLLSAELEGFYLHSLLIHAPWMEYKEVAQQKRAWQEFQGMFEDYARTCLSAAARSNQNYKQEALTHKTRIDLHQSLRSFLHLAQQFAQDYAYDSTAFPDPDMSIYDHRITIEFYYRSAKGIPITVTAHYLHFFEISPRWYQQSFPFTRRPEKMSEGDHQLKDYLQYTQRIPCPPYPPHEPEGSDQMFMNSDWSIDADQLKKIVLGLTGTNGHSLGPHLHIRTSWRSVTEVENPVPPHFFFSQED